jgi:formylmethanofuran dehydrogenase subunit C
MKQKKGRDYKITRQWTDENRLAKNCLGKSIEAAKTRGEIDGVNLFLNSLTIKTKEKKMKNLKNSSLCAVASLILIFAPAFTLATCGGGEDNGYDDSDDNPGNNPGDQNPSDGGHNNATVYVSGDCGIACYWENETEKDLPIAGSDGYTSGITVQGGNVCISGGFSSADSLIACYWKNGTRTDLSGLDTSGIVIQGDNVYVSGMYVDVDDDDVYIKFDRYSDMASCYWKDGTRIDLPIPDGTKSITTGISVQGGNVYVSGIYSDLVNDGYNFNYGTACYWKDGTRIDLPIPDETKSTTTGISVQGSNVYVSGTYSYKNSFNSTACYWLNETRTDLTVSGGTNSATTGISVQGGDVYISGNYGDSACYWKNGTRTDLSGWTTSGIVIQSGDVYVSGIYLFYSGTYPFKIPCYWVNGTRVNLRDQGTYYGLNTTGIAVVSQ